MPYVAKAVAEYYNGQKAVLFSASNEDGKAVEFATKGECQEFCAELNSEVVHLSHNQASQTKFTPLWVSGKKEKRPFWAQ